MIEIAPPPWVEPLLAAGAAYRSDAEKVGLAVELARRNIEHGTGGPFGAAVFLIGAEHPIAVGTNAVLRLGNSAAHAETTALMFAEAVLGTHELGRHELFVSCEPCAMCLGAIHAAGIERLVFAAHREDAEAIGFDDGPVFPQSYEYVEARGLVVARGVDRDAGAAVLREYADRGGPIYG